MGLRGGGEITVPFFLGTRQGSIIGYILTKGSNVLKSFSHGAA